MSKLFRQNVQQLEVIISKSHDNYVCLSLLIKQEIQPAMKSSAERSEDSNDKIRRHRNNLLSMLSLKRSILEYEKSPSQKQLPQTAKGGTMQVGEQAKSGKFKQSKTIHTDMSACTSDRLLDRHNRNHTLSHQLTHPQRCPTKPTLKRTLQPDTQIDLRKEINSKINAQRPEQQGKQEGKEGNNRVSQFLEKYKSSYRMEGRKLTAADKQHMQIERMAKEAANKLKDTTDTVQDSLPPQSPKEEHQNIKKSQLNIRPTIKARLEARRQLPSKTLLKQRYQIMERIGRGLSGEVYKAMDILSERIVAIKMIVQTGVRQEEWQFYKSMQHRNIVTYYNNFKSGGHRYLVLQYFPYTLHRLCKNRSLSIDQTKRVFRGVANGLLFLHGLSIAHRDIKLDNIVVSEDLSEVKFIDFGLCIDLSKCEGQLTREFCGTVHYMPPEILEKRAYNAKKADIWSLGVVLYRLLFNRYPFNAKNQFQMLQKIRKTKLVVGDCPPELACLLEGMLNKDPADRLSILDVLDNKWVS